MNPAARALTNDLWTPSSPSRFAKLLAAAVLLVAAVWAIREHLSVSVLPYDDAFITFRYVENLVHGAGLTYNPPQRVWGFTSPLYVVWLTALRVVFSGVDLPTLAVRANVAFVLASGVATLLLMYRYTADLRIASLGAFVILVHPSLLSISAGGMESGLFLTLTLFAFLAMTSSRRILAGALIGLAFLARPEAVILVPIALLRYWRTPRQLLAILVTAGLVAGAWLVFAAAYYQSIVPLPIVAKNQPLYPLPAGHALRVMFGYLGPALVGPLPSASFGRDLLVGGVLVATTAACVVYSPLRARHAWMPGMFAILAIASYGYGNPMFFEWYWPAILATVLITVVVGAVGSIRLAMRAPFLPRIRRLRYALAYWAVPLWLLITTAVAYDDDAGGHSRSIRFVDEDGTRLRILTYRYIGEALTAATAGMGSIAAAEVGALGYYFPGRMIDACGLVSPEAIRFLPVPEEQRMGSTAGAISVELVRATDPDWVVSMPIFAQNSLLKSEWFHERYELKSTVPLRKICFNSKTVLVFKRRTNK